jgi:poly(glycerol-phosphate) alpha-glucosyltransferase
MSVIALPDGLYLSVAGRVIPNSGGQTRALLLRNRLFAQHTNVRPVVLSFDDTPHYPSIRETLLEQGQLLESMRLLNAYEWHRDNSIDELPPTGDVLPEITDLIPVDVPHPDGSVYQTHYVRRFSGDLVVQDYRRADGSVYLRVPAVAASAASPFSKVYLVNSKGEPVGRWTTQREWRKYWITSLLEPDRPAFLFCDSRYAIADILPMSDPRLHIIHVLHNMHVASPYHVNSRLIRSYAHLMNSLRHLDALVTLTRRQRDDVAERFGALANMDVVPHPVNLPSAPDPLPPREAKRFVVLARLERQKGLEDAIEAFALVLAQEPDAKLDIYGVGGQQERLLKDIERLGVQDSVTLRGHDRNAAETLWTATGMLVTSRFEGYSLAILEARSQGCPVVTYDIKYGPREQIDSGVDGFLVAPGDVRGLADGVLALIRDPELAARMGITAREKTKEQNYQRFLHDWRRVLEGVTANRSFRTRITSVDLQVSRLGYRRAGRLPDNMAQGPLRRLGGRRSASAGFKNPPMVQFAGRLKITGKSKSSTMEDVRLTLDAVNQATGESVPLPLSVRRSGSTFRLSSDFQLAQIFEKIDDSNLVHLRLRAVWHNSAWETRLGRPSRLAPSYELSYAGDGTLSILHNTEGPEGADS